MSQNLDTPVQRSTMSPPALHDEDDALRPFRDLLGYVRQYAREKPEVAALTCLAVGFVLGWKLKPW